VDVVLYLLPPRAVLAQWCVPIVFDLYPHLNQLTSPITLILTDSHSLSTQLSPVSSEGSTTRYSDEKVANRDTTVWHGATENGP
jgi:hypothetical protein